MSHFHTDRLLKSQGRVGWLINFSRLARKKYIHNYNCVASGFLFSLHRILQIVEDIFYAHEKIYRVNIAYFCFFIEQIQQNEAEDSYMRFLSAVQPLSSGVTAP